jgi:hypothetical protein
MPDPAISKERSASGFFIHVIALVVLATVALPAQEVGTALLSMVMADTKGSDAEELLNQFELSDSPPPMSDSTSDELSSSSSEVSPLVSQNILNLPEFTGESANAKSNSSTLSDEVMAAMSSTMGSGKRKLADGEGAYYFGVEAAGEKFVFIIDSSRSMLGRRWNTAIFELTKTLGNLGPDQKFSVICFDVTARPLFDQPTAYYKPTKKVISQISYWMKSLINGRDTRPAEAIDLAMKMAPDAIFILSDGEIRDMTQELLKKANRGEDGNPLIPIHTISLFSDEGKTTLEQIASENGGTFTVVD